MSQIDIMYGVYFVRDSDEIINTVYFQQVCLI